MTRTALYRCFDDLGQLLYVGISDRLEARGKEHRASAEWGGQVARTVADWFDDRAEAVAAEATAIANERPLFNKAHRKAELSFGCVDEGMPLRDWLKENKVGQADFARHIGVTQATVSRFASGLVTPSLAVAVLIESATHGAVRPASWVPSPSKLEAA